MLVGTHQRVYYFVFYLNSREKQIDRTLKVITVSNARIIRVSRIAFCGGTHPHEILASFLQTITKTVKICYKCRTKPPSVCFSK